MALICQVCNTINPDGMRFCDQCSAPLPPSSQGSNNHNQGYSEYTVPAIPTPFYPQTAPNQRYRAERPNYNQPTAQTNPYEPTQIVMPPDGATQVSPTPTPLPYNPPPPSTHSQGTGPQNFTSVNPLPVAQTTQPPGKVSKPAISSNEAGLTVTRGAQPREKFKLNPGFNEIGRWDEVENYYPHIDLDKQDANGFIHRRHAFILFEEGNWWIEDAGGANGTKVRRGDQTIRLAPRGTLQLQTGDEIIIGRVFLLFECS